MADKANRYVAMEKFSKVATSTDAGNDYIEFTVPYAPVGMIAQVLSVTTGALNATGLAVTYNSTTGKVKVAVTALAEGDLVSLSCF